MTHKEALQILIRSASKDIKGAGLGYRSTSEARREEVRTAIEKVFPKAFDREMHESDKYNLF